MSIYLLAEAGGLCRWAHVSDARRAPRRLHHVAASRWLQPAASQVAVDL